MSTTISGTTGIDKVQDGTTINASSIMGALNATGSAPIYACRAWVNFNGTGTVAIRASGNVSSITDNGTGDYTVNLTVSMIDSNFAVVGTPSREVVSGFDGNVMQANYIINSSSFRLIHKANDLSARDCLYCSAAVLR